MKKSLLLCLLLLAGSAFAQSSVFTRFDGWLAKYSAASSDAERLALRSPGLALAEERHVALLSLMKADPQAALKVTHRREEVPAFVATMMEAPFDTTGRFNVLCELGRPLRYEIELGRKQFDITPYNEWTRLKTRDGLHLSGFSLEKQAVLDDRHVLRDDVPQQSPYTVGTKKLLYIRVDFSDDPGSPITDGTAQLRIDELNTFIKSASYNRTNIVGTIVPTIVRVPGTKASYGSQNATSQLLADARTGSRNAGYDPSAYDFEAVAFRNVGAWSWAGLGFVGQRGLWLNGYYDLRVFGHEFGHNLGLSHANFWQASNDTIIGAGNSLEYGNPYDIMGDGDRSHYGAWYKYDIIDWLPAGEIGFATASGSYAIQDLEQPILGGLHGLKVPISASRDYWVEFRPVNGGLLSRGALVYWGFPNATSSQLLDMTPWSQEANDAALEIGRTFSDPGAGIHITATNVTAGNPNSINIVVNRGAFTGNHAPVVSLAASTTQASVGAQVTFTATATDADADTLAYWWDFGDASANQNQATFTRSFTGQRDVIARVTVSDMKGGIGSAQVLVRVGNPGTVRVSGRVAENTTGIEGVRIINGSRWTFTNSNGEYTLVGVNSGSQTITAVKPGWTLSPIFANPLQVPAAGSTGIDFTASRAGFGIFGRVTSLGQGVSGATISAGPYSTLTNSTGDYQLTNVPNGIYSLSVNAGPGRAFNAVGWSNPVAVNGSAVTGRNFSENVVAVTIEVAGSAGPHAVSNAHSTWMTVLNGSTWSVTVPVPPGLYNFFGSTPGQILTPAGFTNPVSVGNGAITLHFGSVPGTAFHILGRIDEAGAPLAGAVVTVMNGATSAGTSTTDAEGRYVVLNVPNATYDVTPAKSGYTFSPMTRSVAVNGADATNIDFGVLGANASPTIAIPPSATPIPIVGTTADLFVMGDDAAPGDEASLTYTWTQVFGPANVTFSRNGTNGAKNTTVTFPRAGAWGFRVTVTDPGNRSATAELTVVVPQTPTVVAVTPPMTTMNVGEAKQFVASVTDQFGTVIDGATDAMWTTSGCGTITEFGKFTAESTGTCTVTATMLGKMGICTVKVQLSPVPRITMAPKVTPSPVMGKTGQASVLADDDGGESKLKYTWSASNPPGAVTFSENNSNAAKNTTVTFGALGTYVLRVDVVDEDDLTTSDFVTVEVVKGLALLAITTDTPMVPAGGTARFKVVNDGADVTGCVWSTSGGGTIDNTGLFTAGSALGTFQVTAQCTDGSPSTDVTVIKGGTTKPCGCSSSSESSALFTLLGFAVLSLRRRRALS